MYFKSLENKTRNNGSQERQDTFLKSGVAPWYGGLHSGSTLRRSTVLISMGTSYFHILLTSQEKTSCEEGVLAIVENRHITNIKICRPLLLKKDASST